MDKKYIERPQKFDKNQYNSNYSKKHYKNFSIVIKPELKEQIENYCKEENISKAEFLRRAFDILNTQKNK
ncbi:MAG: hypothetical protein K2J11_10255 [Oscillospiraceae bacterium]|nr:hypothetical protein [Oscillospiraceae bacterium]